MKVPTDEEIDKAILRLDLENSLLKYVQWSFENKTKKKFILNWHHEKICETLEKVYRHEIKRLVINIPPRYSKTEIAVKSFIEWSLAKDASSKFIHLSYSDMLALDNSASIRDSIKSDWYSNLWPIDIRRDQDSKQLWYTQNGGGVYATGAEGSITGFGAGTTGNDWGGCMIIDDPQKPGEATSEASRERINLRLVDTFMSRLNNPQETPIIIIMQRLHEDDMSGFCLAGNTGDEWHHLCIPALDENDNPLWEIKHNKEHLLKMREANPIVFAGQYMQSPRAGTGNMFTANMFEFGPIPPEQDYSYITVDTAYKDKQQNDCTAMAAAKIIGDQIYIDKIFNERIKAEDAETYLSTFASSFIQFGFRGIYIEPKGHGIYLNQSLPKKGFLIPPESEIKEFYKDRRLSKIERASNALPHMNGRKIIINHNIPNKEAILEQILSFPKAKHDDVVDCIIDLIKLAYSRKPSILDALW